MHLSRAGGCLLLLPTFPPFSLSGPGVLGRQFRQLQWQKSDPTKHKARVWGWWQMDVGRCPFCARPAELPFHLLFFFARLFFWGKWCRDSSSLLRSSVTAPACPQPAAGTELGSDPSFQEKPLEFASWAGLLHPCWSWGWAGKLSWRSPWGQGAGRSPSPQDTAPALGFHLAQLVAPCSQGW